MKKFLIIVNGNPYEVEVEEIRAEGVTVSQAVPEARIAPAVPAATQPVPAPAPKVEKKTQAAAPSGAVKITAPMPGTILSISVNTGDTVKKGQVLLILEAMKMENEIVAPNDGKVASINVSKGSSVNAGDLLVSLA
jgi:biotin carboxyl carrier protein